MSETTRGAVRNFEHRTGGYINFLYDSKKLLNLEGELRPGYSIEDHMHTEEQVDQMLDDINSFMEKYYPWMKDFIVFQLDDGTVRVDASNREFLGKY